MLSFFPRDVLDEIFNLIESVSDGFPSYSLVVALLLLLLQLLIIMIIINGYNNDYGNDTYYNHGV